MVIREGEGEGDGETAQELVCKPVYEGWGGGGGGVKVLQVLHRL